jgi:hypothetical protein
VLRRSDVLAGAQPLVTIALASIRSGSPVSREIAMPSGAWWKRMIRSYALPEVLVAAVNLTTHEEGRGRRVYRADEVGLIVAVS